MKADMLVDELDSPFVKEGDGMEGVGVVDETSLLKELLMVDGSRERLGTNVKLFIPSKHPALFG